MKLNYNSCVRVSVKRIFLQILTHLSYSEHKNNENTICLKYTSRILPLAGHLQERNDEISLGENVGN